jgi:hypothetical protein
MCPQKKNNPNVMETFQTALQLANVAFLKNGQADLYKNSDLSFSITLAVYPKFLTRLDFSFRIWSGCV